MPDYDYCITGAGCAGLSLLVRILLTPALRDKKILLVDRTLRSATDRTWCYWEKENGLFQEIVYRQWARLRFHGQGQHRLLHTDPYIYKMIRGVDFYTWCFNLISQYPNVTVQTGEVSALHSDLHTTYAVIDGKVNTAAWIFNSIPFSYQPQPLRHWHLLQHFKGWVIRSLRPSFQPGEATLMDFRTPQDMGAAFVYVMPFSPTEALVEYTLFSASVLSEDLYTTRLVRYISDILRINDYIIRRNEFGIIPMTTQPFPQNENSIRHIGTAGGLTKPSSGYTFQFIQRDSANIVQSLIREDRPGEPASSPRFRFYDRVLLNVLSTKKMAGEAVFANLFANNCLTDLFAFLDNASVPQQDWKIIRSLPTLPFLQAAAGEFLRSMMRFALPANDPKNQPPAPRNEPSQPSAPPLDPPTDRRAHRPQPPEHSNAKTTESEYPYPPPSVKWHSND